MYLGTKFKNITFGCIRDSKRERITKDTWKPGKVGMGVAHIHDIKYEEDMHGLLSLCGGQVDLYVDMFKTLNKKIWTHHKVLMEKLEMWERFQKFKRQVVDDLGRPIKDADITEEKEFWFGFTRRAPGPWDRKDRMFEWSGISCTLNSWIWDDYYSGPFNFLTGAIWREEAAPQVVSKAGKKKSDKKEAEMINIIPPNLWQLILHELYKLTPGDASNFPVWNNRRTSEKDSAKAMKSLVLQSAKGSMIYEVDVGFRFLGKSKNGFQLFCEVLIGLMEQEKMKKDDQFQLKVLKLYWNNLKDIHLDTIYMLVKKCPQLKRLWLSGNEFTRKGCWKAVKWCREFKLDVILIGHEGWSIGLNKYQRRLVNSPWMHETDLTLQLTNYYVITLMRYPSYAFNEILAVQDIKQLFRGISSLAEAKYVHDMFFPMHSNVTREIFQIEDEEKVQRPDSIKLMIKAVKIVQEGGFNWDNVQPMEVLLPSLLSDPDIASIFKNLRNPQILKEITGLLSLLNKDATKYLENIFKSSLVRGDDELKID
jgi:hypothetical protein